MPPQATMARMMEAEMMRCFMVYRVPFITVIPLFPKELRWASYSD